MSAKLPFDPVRESYVSLATFRKSGREVRTPVWIAPAGSATEGGTLFVYTNITSGKVKRIRANGRCRLAACDVRGRVHGEWVDATARLLEDPAQIERGFAAIVTKYAWQMRLALFVSRLSGRYAQRAILEIHV